MKITFPRTAFLTAISAVTPAIASKSPTDILKSICLTVTDAGAVLMASDSEIGIRYEIKDVTATKNGTVVLPPGRFGQILREISDETVEMEVTGTTVKVVAGSSKFKLQTVEPDAFPAPKEFTESAYHVVKAGSFKRAIDRVAFCCDTESVRYALGGVCIDLTEPGKMTAVATDSRRLGIASLARAEVGEAFKPSASESVVPSKALKLVTAALPDGDADVSIAFTPSAVSIKCNGIVITARMIEGRFPRYADVVPSEYNHEVSGVVGPLLCAVRQAMITTNEESRGVDFSFDDGNLTLKSIGAEVGDSEIEIPFQVDGKPIELTLEPKYVVQFLKACADTDQVIGKFVDPDSATVFSCGDDYRYVIMPLARD